MNSTYEKSQNLRTTEIFLRTYAHNSEQHARFWWSVHHTTSCHASEENLTLNLRKTFDQCSIRSFWSAVWGFCWYHSPFWGPKSPKTPFSGKTHKILKLVYYRNYHTGSNQILHSDKDHQMFFLCDPKSSKTNPIWRTAAILKKIEKWFDQRFDLRVSQCSAVVLTLL